jgi:hypothetical protein
MTTTRFAPFFVAALAAGCVGKTLDVGSNDDAGGGDDAAADDGGGGGPCAATCRTPAGTVQPATSLQEAYSQVAGRWLVCTGIHDLPDLPADVIGLEFGPASIGDASCVAITQTGPDCGGGNLYYLVNGPSGPVRGSGFAYQLTYNIAYSSGSYGLSIHNGPNSGLGATFRYSPCPLELELDGLESPTPVTMVAMP